MRRDIITVNLSNPQHNVTERQQRAALRSYIRAHHPAVIATQEAVSNLKAPRGYVKYAGKGGVSELAIFVRNDIAVVGHGAHKSVSGVGGHWPDRGFTWVQLADGLVVIDVHPNSGIEAAGRPKDGLAWEVTKDRHFPDIDAAIALHARTGRVVVLGDWNIDRAADTRRRSPLFPALRFSKQGLGELVYAGHSLGGRSVDRIFVERTQLTGEAKLLAKQHPRFDHRPVWVRLTYR